jgi:hypothetical protein
MIFDKSLFRTTWYSQKDEDEQKEPEKVHVLDWEAYKEKADTNKPNPRTTFYG